MKIHGNRTRHIFARALALWVQEQMKAHGACNSQYCPLVIRALGESMDGEYTFEEFLAMWEIFHRHGHHPDEHYAANIPKEHLL